MVNKSVSDNGGVRWLTQAGAYLYDKGNLSLSRLSDIYSIRVLRDLKERTRIVASKLREWYIVRAPLFSASNAHTPRGRR